MLVDVEVASNSRGTKVANCAKTQKMHPSGIWLEFCMMLVKTVLGYSNAVLGKCILYAAKVKLSKLS